MDNPRLEIQEHQQALEQVLNFTESDFKANQAGRLGESQRQALIKKRREIVVSVETWLTIILILFLILFGIFCMVLIFMFPFGLVSFYAAYGLGKPLLQKYRFLDRSITEGIVLQTTGRITLNIKQLSSLVKYEVILNGERVFLIKDGQALLIFKNGQTYTLYHLPGDQTLLSAEWLPDHAISHFTTTPIGKNKPESLKHPQVLAQALHFSEDDLILNQEGIIGVNQSRQLDKQFERKLLIIFGPVVFGVFLIVIAILHPELGIGGFALFVFFLAVVNLQRLIHFLKWYRDYRSRQIVTAEGLIELKIWQQGYTIQLGDLSFHLNSKAAFAFKNGDPYRLYYLPESLTLLSAEWLRDDQLFIDEETDESQA